MSLDPKRTVQELHELQRLTGNATGAQRIAWTPTWERARAWLRSKLDEMPGNVEIDEAGNQWFTVSGQSERCILIGGHLDSVPNGGWLDGSLNVLAGLEVIRTIAEGPQPPVSVRLVDWADEEGVRFGRSLFGSSAAAGNMTDLDELRERVDQQGISLPEALRKFDVELDSAPRAQRQIQHAAAYLELHIEQGPVLESMDLPLGVVLGTRGVERHQVTFIGQAAHAGSTPMHLRHDALVAAAELVIALTAGARRVGDDAVATCGGIICQPGIPTAIVERATMLIDQRHIDAAKLARMLTEAKDASQETADRHGLTVSWERIWSRKPVSFNRDLVELADRVVQEIAGNSFRMSSGALHDATEIALGGIPTVMLFVQSLHGLSHTPLEDTREDYLELAVRALDRLTSAVMQHISHM